MSESDRCNPQECTITEFRSRLEVSSADVEVSHENLPAAAQIWTVQSQYSLKLFVCFLFRSNVQVLEVTTNIHKLGVNTEGDVDDLSTRVGSLALSTQPEQRSMTESFADIENSASDLVVPSQQFQDNTTLVERGRILVDNDGPVVEETGQPLPEMVRFIETIAHSVAHDQAQERMPKPAGRSVRRHGRRLASRREREEKKNALRVRSGANRQALWAALEQDRINGCLSPAHVSHLEKMKRKGCGGHGGQAWVRPTE